MNRCNELSIATKNYLEAFYFILDKMIRDMTDVELTNSISYNFMIQMIPHHRAAIEMSENILIYTTNIQVQNIALGIIEAQTKSIEDMQSIECTCSEVTNSDQELCAYQNEMDQIMQVMFSEMSDARATNQMNCNFMREMIPHHLGAVRMSETTLQYNICSGLVPILQAIIESQKKGIMQMQRLLRCIGCC